MQVVVQLQVARTASQVYRSHLSTNRQNRKSVESQIVTPFVLKDPDSPKCSTVHRATNQLGNPARIPGSSSSTALGSLFLLLLCLVFSISTHNPPHSHPSNQTTPASFVSSPTLTYLLTYITTFLLILSHTHQLFHLHTASFLSWCRSHAVTPIYPPTYLPTYRYSSILYALWLSSTHHSIAGSVHLHTSFHPALP